MRRGWLLRLALLWLIAVNGDVPLAHPPLAARAASPTVQLSIDTPTDDATVLGEIAITGWAADPAATTGTGIRAVHVYLDLLPWEGGALLGGAEYGLPRADIGQLLGDTRF